MNRRRAEKRLSKMRQNPSKWRFSQVRDALEAFGFELSGRPGGSHRTFRHADVDHVSIPDCGKGPIRAVYVEQALKLVDSVKVVEKAREKERE